MVTVAKMKKCFINNKNPVDLNYRWKELTGSALSEKNGANSKNLFFETEGRKVEKNYP